MINLHVCSSMYVSSFIITMFFSSYNDRLCAPCNLFLKLSLPNVLVLFVPVSYFNEINISMATTKFKEKYKRLRVE